jgi:hypothetical protein
MVETVVWPNATDAAISVTQTAAQTTSDVERFPALLPKRLLTGIRLIPFMIPPPRELMEPSLYLYYAILRLGTAGLKNKARQKEKLRKPSDQRSAI